MRLHCHIPTLHQFALYAAADGVLEHGMEGLKRQMPVPLYLRCIMAFAHKYGDKMTIMKLYQLSIRGDVPVPSIDYVSISTIITMLDHVVIAAADVTELSDVFTSLISQSKDDPDAVIEAIHRFASRCALVGKSSVVTTLVSTGLKLLPCKVIREVLIRYGACLDHNDTAYLRNAISCGMSDVVHDVVSQLSVLNVVRGDTFVPSDMIKAIESGDSSTIEIVSDALGDRASVSHFNCFDMTLDMCNQLVTLGVLKSNAKYILHDVRSVPVLHWFIGNNSINLGRCMIEMIENALGRGGPFLDVLRYVIELPNVTVPKGVLARVSSAYTVDLAVLGLLMSHGGADDVMPPNDERSCLLLLRYWIDKGMKLYKSMVHRALEYGCRNNVHIIPLRCLINLHCDDGQIDVNYDNHGITLLHLACYHDRIDIVQMLLEPLAWHTNLDVNVVDSRGRKPLEIACQIGDIAMIGLLISRMANVTGVIAQYHRPLCLACENGRHDVVEALLNHGVHANEFLNGESALSIACHVGHRDIVELLLNRHADVNGGVGRTMGTPLHLACDRGWTDIVKLLIDNHADVHRLSVYGETVLHIACRQQHTRIVEMLLKNGADVNTGFAYSGSLVSPLHVACSCGYYEVIELLLDYGASVNSFDCRNRVPLTLAFENKRMDIAYLLLKHGADVNIQRDGDPGRSLLDIAVEKRQLHVTELLLKHGAHVDGGHLSSVNYTPLHMACTSGSLDIVKLLIEHKADVNAHVNGKSPLVVALEQEHLDVAELLIKNGADVNERDCNGKLLLDVALRTKGLHDVVRLLMRYRAGDALMRNACTEGDIEMVKTLLRCRVDVNKRDGNGVRPLHLTYQHGRYAIFKLLLMNGAAVDADDRDGNSLLMTACSRRSYNAACLLVAYGANVNKVNRNRFSPLHYACQSGGISMATLLLNYNAEINAVDADGNSALHVACLNGHHAMADMLLQRGANLNLLNNAGQSPLNMIYDSMSSHMPTAAAAGEATCLSVVKELMAPADVKKCQNLLDFAAENAYFELARLILDSGADVHFNVDSQSNCELLLHRAIEQEDIEIVSLLLKAGVNANCKSFANHHDDDDDDDEDDEHEDDNNDDDDESRYTPLHMACTSGSLDIVKLLIEHKANVNAHVNGKSPLVVALEQDDLDVAELLIEHKADVNAHVNGKSPLIVALEQDDLDVAQLLIKNGADVNERDRNGKTPLTNAYENGHFHVVELLLNHAADVNDRNGLRFDVRFTPLHKACSRGNRNVVEWLINHKANVNICDMFHRTPLTMAVHNPDRDIVVLLLNHGADISVIDINGNMPIHIACKLGHKEIVELLLPLIIDIDVVGQNGNTPLHLACDGSHLDVIQMLVSRGADVSKPNQDGQTPLDIANKRNLSVSTFSVQTPRENAVNN